MNEKLRAAMERRRQALIDYGDHDGGYPATSAGRMQSLNDMACLADAFLAEHDPTPIDAELLERLGFKRATHVPVFTSPNNENDSSLVLHFFSNAEEASFENDEGESVEVAFPRTKGELMTLLSVLCVKTNEGE